MTGRRQIPVCHMEFCFKSKVSILQNQFASVFSDLTFSDLKDQQLKVTSAESPLEDHDSNITNDVISSAIKSMGIHPAAVPKDCAIELFVSLRLNSAHFINRDLLP